MSMTLHQALCKLGLGDARPKKIPFEEIGLEGASMSGALTKEQSDAVIALLEKENKRDNI